MGKKQHEPGAKLDAGKPNMDLVLGEFPRALRGVGDVGTYGANKYTPKGWTYVPDGPSRYLSAMLRHYLDYSSGEECDVESGLNHLAHLAWNALAAYELTCRQKYSPLTQKQLGSALEKELGPSMYRPVIVMETASVGDGKSIPLPDVSL